MGAQYYDAKWVKKAITRLVLVETLFGWHCAAHQAVPPRVRQGSGGHQHGPDGVRGGVGERLLHRMYVCILRRPPHTRSRSPCTMGMAAVAGDAENINKQARKMRTNWVAHKQTADGFLRSAAVEGARTA